MGLDLVSGEMWTKTAKLCRESSPIANLLAYATLTFRRTWLWGYVGKPQIACERKPMSPINRLNTTTDSKNLFELGKKRGG